MWDRSHSLALSSSSMAFMSFSSLIVLSAIFRFILILYGEWQDTHMEVRYTDIDYLVFSDAASLMTSGKSPFQRSTYRYSPLLAFLLIPNSILHPTWGKFIFSASGKWKKFTWLMLFFGKVWFFFFFPFSHKCLVDGKIADLLVGLFIRTILKLRGVPENLCTVSVSVWLLNPFTFTIGTRGNCEPVVCAMVLWIFICLMNGVSFSLSFTIFLLKHYFCLRRII